MKTSFPFAFASAIALILTAACSVSVPAEDISAPPAATKTSKKGGGSRSPEEAKSSGQKTGSKAGERVTSEDALDEAPDGIVCNEDLEGLGYCTDDETIVFCAGEQWYELACERVESGAFCGQNIETSEIDCYVFDEDGDHELVDDDG